MDINESIETLESQVLAISAALASVMTTLDPAKAGLAAFQLRNSLAADKAAEDVAPRVAAGRNAIVAAYVDLLEKIAHG